MYTCICSTYLNSINDFWLDSYVTSTNEYLNTVAEFMLALQRISLLKFFPLGDSLEKRTRSTNDDVGMALIPSSLISAAYWFRIAVIRVVVVEL